MVSSLDTVIYPHLSNVSCGIDKALELLVSDFVDVHVEGVNKHQPLRALAICRDAWVVCPHQELSSRNQHHLRAVNKLHCKQTNGPMNLLRLKKVTELKG